MNAHTTEMAHTTAQHGKGKSKLNVIKDYNTNMSNITRADITLVFKRQFDGLRKWVFNVYILKINSHFLYKKFLGARKTMGIVTFKKTIV